MPDLEPQISEWRSQMLAAGIPDDAAAELESHVREDISRLIQAGADESQAAGMAIQRIGPAAALKTEFFKSRNKTKGVIMTRILATLIGLFGMAFGLGLILPALAHHNHHPGAWTGQEIYPLTLGAAILVIGACAAFYCIRTRREARGRIVIAVALFLASVPFFGTALISALGHAAELTPAGWVVLLIAVAASAIYFGTCFRYNWRQPRSVSN